MENGEEIAVKKLTPGSTQGREEFSNEVRLLLKLQHRNLVRLFGCCVEGENRMLVYQYMKNRSLNYFLFGNISFANSPNRYLNCFIINLLASLRLRLGLIFFQTKTQPISFSSQDSKDLDLNRIQFNI